MHYLFVIYFFVSLIRYDALSVEIQYKCYDEINSFLQDAIEGALDAEYEKLSSKDKFFVNYSQCYYDNGYDPEAVRRQICSRFHELLNEHWQTKKITNFGLSKSR